MCELNCPIPENDKIIFPDLRKNERQQNRFYERLKRQSSDGKSKAGSKRRNESMVGMRPSANAYSVLVDRGVACWSCLIRIPFSFIYFGIVVTSSPVPVQRGNGTGNTTSPSLCRVPSIRAMPRSNNRNAIYSGGTGSFCPAACALIIPIRSNSV